MNDANLRRSLLVCCDLTRYDTADDQYHRSRQELVAQSLGRAGTAADLDRSTWQRQLEGDREFAVLPPETPECSVVDRYVRSLSVELQSVNRYRVPEAKVRMRLAIHHGLDAEDSVLVTALLGSSAVHAAMDGFPSPDLVVILSAHLYDSLVAPGRTTLRPDDFRRVEVREQSFDGHGWMWLPDAEVHSLDLDTPSARPTSSRPWGQHAFQER